MLDQVVIDRAAAELTILGAPAQRDALLDLPGTDKAIRKLDTDVEAAHLLIERLDRVRPELDARIGAATAATRVDAWVAMRSRLVEQITSTKHLMRLAEAAFITTCELRLEAQRAGFVAETAALPYHADAYRVHSGVMGQMATSIAAQPLIVPRDPPLWNVRFLAWTTMFPGTQFLTGYLEGQEAGFSAEMAWALVDAGKAEWTDPKRRPPKPRKRKKGEKAASVSLEVASMFGAGPADPAEPVQTGGRKAKPLALPAPSGNAVFGEAGNGA